MTENELKHQVLRIARLNGWMVHQSTQNRIVRPDKAGSGYPDLTLARDGEVLWIELKTEDGIVSSDQYAWSLALHPHCHTIRPSDVDGRLMELLA